MLKVEVIGNLGADAERKSENGRNYVSFRVAHSEKYTNGSGVTQETTVWISAFLNGDGGKVYDYLKKGVKVFIRGNLSTNIYDSATHHCKMVGLTVNVTEIQLCGSVQQAAPQAGLQTGQQAAPQAGQQAGQQASKPEDKDDDLPF